MRIQISDYDFHSFNPFILPLPPPLATPPCHPPLPSSPIPQTPSSLQLKKILLVCLIRKRKSISTPPLITSSAAPPRPQHRLDRSINQSLNISVPLIPQTSRRAHSTPQPSCHFSSLLLRTPEKALSLSCDHVIPQLVRSTEAR